ASLSFCHRPVPTEIYTLALHDALPICQGRAWMVREFYGAPWPLVELDTATVELLAPIADAARGLAQAHAGPPVDLFRLARVERRSEEHTSELQSRENLVCRLLLEKNKK